MTEDEADKILDLLKRRCARMMHINHKTNNHVDIAFKLKKFFVDKHHRLFILMKIDKKLSWRAITTSSAVKNNNIVVMHHALTSMNIVKQLFKMAEANDVFLGWVWEFIYKGETPEEIQIKADLEDV